MINIIDDPSSAHFFRDKTAKESVRADISNIVANNLEKTATRHLSHVSAAALIFMHSVTDSTLFRFCNLIGTEKIEKFFSKIKRNQVSLETIRDISYEQICMNKTEDYLAKLERESMLQKTEVLLSCIEPNSGTLKVGSCFVFNQDRLKEIDALRHKLVHGELPSLTIPIQDQNIGYLMNTCVMFSNLVGQFCNLSADPSFNYWKE